uniref:Uncharacterized protein n=1 Tax=Brassica oleracea TaxID=3712 RepID=A0A3P6FTZ0_BRAOL|nr:unnamed protein product [Brassica oleracea]
MVTPFLSRFRPPPDPPPPDLPPWSLCKSRPFTARFLIVPPEPPDAPLLLAPLLQTLESSINPVVFLPRCSSPVPGLMLLKMKVLDSVSMVWMKLMTLKALLGYYMGSQPLQPKL